MSKRHEFRPTMDGALEARTVMSGGLLPISPATGLPFAPNQVLTTRTLSQVATQINSSFNRFSNDVRNAFFRIVASPTDGLGANDLNRFNTYAFVRGNRLAAELTNQSGRIPFGRMNLAPALQDDVGGMVNNLTSVVALTDNIGTAGPTVASGRAAVLGDLRAYVSAGVSGGNFALVQGHR